jgi:hypothetical protein
VTAPKTDDEARDGTGAKRCVDCGAPISGKRDQCLECRFMPSPWAAAVAVMGMLTLGVLIGSATSQVAQSAGLTSIILEASSAAPAPEEETAEPAETATAPEPAPILPATTSSFTAPVPLPEEPTAEEPIEPELPPELPEEEALPPVKHLFLIALGEIGYEESFGATSPAPYLAKSLAEKGELLANYYAVTKGDLANQIAMLSGQGPTPETATNCPTYADLLPGTLSAEGQVGGAGCVYPATTPTLPGQLLEKELGWKAYVEDIDKGVPSGQPASCRHPALGAADPSQAPLPGDAYVTWRNPVVFFHSLTDGPECAQNDVGLEQLASDLKAAKSTPALSYIVPNACHDGGETPCEPGLPSGALEVESFLQRVVPAIEASPAYKEGGLIAITAAQARQAGPTADASSCCIAPQYPNLPADPAAEEPATGPVKPSGGGGKVGLLLISPFVAPGSVNESGYYNHYSLLRSIEELFELEPLGYAAEPALTGFDASVYNAEESTVSAYSGSSSRSANCRDCASRTPSADHSSPSSSKNPWRAIFDSKATR